MKKTVSRDPLVLLDILDMQQLITDTIDGKDITEVAKDTSKVATLSYALMRMGTVSKALSSKTKKEVEDALPEDFAKRLVGALSSPICTVHPLIIVKHAEDISTPYCKGIIKDTYTTLNDK